VAAIIVWQVSKDNSLRIAGRWSTAIISNLSR